MEASDLCVAFAGFKDDEIIMSLCLCAHVEARGQPQVLCLRRHPPWDMLSLYFKGRFLIDLGL